MYNFPRLLPYVSWRIYPDNNFNTAILKFEAAYNKLYVARISSALSCYGKSFLNSNKRGKIKVQATAVARKKNGSRQKQDYGHIKNL